MNSSDLLKFDKWIQLDSLLDPQFQDKVPYESGIYVFRLDRIFGRLLGESDILYIGSNEGGGTINDRLIKNYLKGTGGRTTRRIHHYLFRKDYVKKVSVCWIITRNFQFEKELLERYEEQHDELPPWNRVR